MFTKRVHVFRSGDQTSAQGVHRHFSPKELDQVVKTYDPSVHEAPLVVGHAGDNDSLPAFGWIKGFNREGENLYADVEFSDAAKDLVKNGHYRKVSISFYSPDSAINPHKGKWSARHLALLGASPPAVKGLEPFTFSEAEGIYDFAITLSPADIFDEELGPTLMVDKSPLQMLQEKLSAVREDMSSAVKDLQQGSQEQQTNQLDEVATSSVTTQPEAAQMANPDASQFAETRKLSGREGTEIAQQTADLETQFPEEEFMEQGQISRKHAKGAHGQVMQVVENVYDEAHKESTAERKAAADRAAEAKRMKKEGKGAEAREVKRFGKEEDELLSKDHKELPPALKARAAQVKAQGHFAEDHEESDMTDSGVMKRHGGDGGPAPRKQKSSNYAEIGKAEDDDEGRYETARSTDNGYVDRMKVGKQGADGNTGRMKLAKSSEQDRDRLNTAESDEQEDDRFNTAKASEADAEGESRWAGQADGYDQAMNSDQYDVGANDYPEPNRPKTSKGTDPYGRDESQTKMPTESEEMPDDEIFAVQTTNVMNDKNMRVLRTKSSDAKAKSVATHDYLYGEPEADEMTTEKGVTTARKSMKGSKMVEHAEYETDDADSEASLDTLRDEIGDGKKSKNRQLIPGAMDDTDTPGQTVGPDGAYSESYRGEKKSTNKQLVPGAMDETDVADETVGPDGAFGESLESLRVNIGDGKKSKARQLTPGAMDDTDTPDETTDKISGKTYSEEHGECGGGKKKDPYTKTGFGSTYEEDMGDEDEADYNEMDYGTMSSGNSARAIGYPTQMFEELKRLKEEHAELQKMYMEEKITSRRNKIASFVEALYDEGRLTDGVMPQGELQHYCEGLEFGTMEFAEGETAASKLLSLLSKLPPMVSFGEVTSGGTFQYAEEDLDPHARALKIVEESEGKIDYVEALKKTMFA
jgi:hypothetical protein